MGRLEDFLKSKMRGPTDPQAPEASEALPSAGPGVEFLWPQGAPGALGTRDVDRPTLTLCLPPPELATGAGVVICPGGDYWDIAGDYEGRDVALWLNTLGVAGFVLKYRLAPSYHYPSQLQDARRAVRLVRHRAAEWGVNPARVGILGFSGGGHLASTIATHFSDGVPDAEDPVDRLSCRPDFVALVCPVISFASKYTHEPTRDNLLGGDSTKTKHLERLSNERQVTPATPPTFLVHTGDDKEVLPENSVLFYVSMRRMGVPGELHIYEKGGHGFGLATTDPALSSWTLRCADWMRRRGLLEKPG
ncbi:MAG TPA: alpha/beta hydrolase [Planctomycetota bacterium]|nr:alpha/beta hydrolase [Planctomycetota bacterium]